MTWLKTEFFLRDSLESKVFSNSSFYLFIIWCISNGKCSRINYYKQKKLTLLIFLLITFLNLFSNFAIFNTLTNNLTCITIYLLWTMVTENKLSCLIFALVANTFRFKLLMLLSQLMHNLLTIFYTWKIIILNHDQLLLISDLAKLLTGFPSNISFKAIRNF